MRNGWPLIERRPRHRRRRRPAQIGEQRARRGPRTRRARRAHQPRPPDATSQRSGRAFVAPQRSPAAPATGSPSALFSGTKKSPTTNHWPTTTRLKMRSRGGEADRAQSATTSATATARPSRQRAQRHRQTSETSAGRDQPAGFVAREARAPRATSPRRTAVPSACGRSPTRSSTAASASNVSAEQQRLGHRRDCRYSTFGFSANERRRRPRRSRTSRSARARSTRSRRTATRKRQQSRSRPPTRRCDRARSICTGSAFSRWGSGSQTAPICCQPGVMLSMIAARDDEVAARVVVAERETERA